MDERFHSYQGEVEDWHWWYKVRRRILEKLIAELDLDPARARLLDVGSGTGGASLVLSRHGSAVALDRAPDSFRLGATRPYRHRVVGDAGQPLPFADGAFDVVCALDVLEHLDDDAALARELYRVCKPGGHVITFVPAFAVLWGYNDEFSHHRRRYVAGQLETVLRNAGLEIRESGYFNLSLFLPTLGARLLQRLFPEQTRGMEHSERRTALNDVLAAIFGLEVGLIGKVRLPAGTSAFCVARRA